MKLSLEDAKTIMYASLGEARRRDLAPISIVVLDSGGHVIAFQREDGASNKRFEIAHGKAHGAVSMGLGSRSLMTRAESQPHFISAAGFVVGPLVPVPGGVLVRDDTGNLVGAVGVTGDKSDNDEQIAVYGIESAGFIAETG